LRNEPCWLSVGDVVEINAANVARTGEPHALIDQGLLESALGRPLNLWLYKDEQDLVRLATALLFGIARNHPFQQGNKRTAWTAFVIMLEDNDQAVEVEDTEATAQAIVDVITGERDENWFCDLVRRQVR
jgi:death on curing protein